MMFLKVMVSKKRFYNKKYLTFSSNFINRFIKLKKHYFIAGGDPNMNDKDKKAFLEDFKKADTTKKMDMWLYALDQEALWDEIMEEMSKIARIKMMKEGGKPVTVEE
jgi:hypothetical protein